MPRSSRHKSHKQSKHSSKEAKEYYSESDEDAVVVRMKEKEKERKEEGSGGGSVRVSRDSGEKRKLSSSALAREGKEGKDLNGNGNGNGDALEEHVSSKRRKGGDCGGGRDDGGASESLRIVDSERSVKSNKESKGFGESRSKSSKRQEGGGEKEEKLVVLGEKDEKSGGGSSRTESKRKSEGRKEGKEKDRGSEREKKGQESKREDTVLVKKQGSQWDDGVEEKLSKKGREINEVPLQDDFRNIELEKELEKRIRKRRDSSGDRDKGHDLREIDEKHLATRSDRPKDGRHKDDKYNKDVFYAEKNLDEVEKDDRHGDAKYRDDVNKDIKYWDNGDRDNKYKDDKYRDDGENDTRRREDKYREDGDRETRRKDDKYRDDGERDSRRRDDKYREDGERETRRRDEKYREDGDKNGRRSDEKHYEDVEKDDRYRDDKYREDSERYKDDKCREDNERYKEDRRREDYEREIRHKDVKLGDDADRERRLRDGKYKDDLAARDRSGDKSDVKRTRDEFHIPDHSLKPTIRDISPPYDERSRPKDDQGRKRKSDREDYGDIKLRSVKDQRYDADKRPISSARADSTSDRGRSTLRNTDLEVSNRSRHQGSPSSREHYRLSKQDESKYREYACEDRGRHGTSTREYGGASGEKLSLSRVVEKNVLKDDSHLLESSAERRSKTDTRASPRQMIDKSPTSQSMDRRHVSRSDVRRSIDVEESGQRSGGSRDAKDYYVKEGRGNRDMPRGDTLPGDDPSQPDGDNMSVSSPFLRPGHFSGNSKSHAPPLFRTGSDGPSNFGSSEDDNRMKFNNRHRRMSDPNMTRVQASPWKGVPSWPSPMANGFIPFQHGPGPVNLHPVMPQFPPGPIFGVRPSMELNHHGVPYHIPDADRFSGHGPPMGWRNPVDDSYPPPLHVWDANNGPFGEENHVYGRPDWDHGRNLHGGRAWETNVDMWKGQKGDGFMEAQFPSEKENQYFGTPADGSLAHQSVEPVQNDETLTDLVDGRNETRHSSVALENKSPENTNITHAVAVDPKKSEKDTANLYQVYLSKLNISAELTDPELYSKCAGLMDVGQNTVSDAEDSKILYIEDVSEVKNSSSRPSAFVLGKINDSIFQKAMTLYRKQREEFVVTSGGENPKLSKLCIEAPKTESIEVMLLSDEQNAEEIKLLPIHVKSEDVSMEDCNEVSDVAILTEVLVKPETTTTDHVAIDRGVATDLMSGEQIIIANCVSVAPKDVEIETSGALPPTSDEEMVVPGDSMGAEMAGMGEVKSPETKACEVVMAESIESESVKLSRIHHHSPESTH